MIIVIVTIINIGIVVITIIVITIIVISIVIYIYIYVYTYIHDIYIYIYILCLFVPPAGPGWASRWSRPIRRGEDRTIATITIAIITSAIITIAIITIASYLKGRRAEDSIWDFSSSSSRSIIIVINGGAAVGCVSRASSPARRGREVRAGSGHVCIYIYIYIHSRCPYSLWLSVSWIAHESCRIVS